MPHAARTPFRTHSSPASPPASRHDSWHPEFGISAAASTTGTIRARFGHDTGTLRARSARYHGHDTGTHAFTGWSPRARYTTGTGWCHHGLVSPRAGVTTGTIRARSDGKRCCSARSANAASIAHAHANAAPISAAAAPSSSKGTADQVVGVHSRYLRHRHSHSFTRFTPLPVTRHIHPAWTKSSPLVPPLAAHRDGVKACAPPDRRALPGIVQLPPRAPPRASARVRPAPSWAGFTAVRQTRAARGYAWPAGAARSLGWTARGAVPGRRGSRPVGWEAQAPEKRLIRRIAVCCSWNCACCGRHHSLHSEQGIPIRHGNIADQSR